jgi:hypothetical protein
VPLITAVSVWVALGAGYYQAREQSKEENAIAGFSQGFVMAILKWKRHNVVARFRRPYLRINKADEGMDVIRVNSYHLGLQNRIFGRIGSFRRRKKRLRQKNPQRWKCQSPETMVGKRIRGSQSTNFVCH